MSARSSQSSLGQNISGRPDKVRSCKIRTRSVHIRSTQVISGQFRTAQIRSGQIKFKTGQVRSGKCQSTSGQEGQIKVSLGQVRPGKGRFRAVHVIVMLCQSQLMTALIVLGQVISVQFSSMSGQGSTGLVRSGQGQVITGQVMPG